MEIKTNIDVLKKYDELVTQTLAGDSIYLRSKEVIQELFEDKTLTANDKAAALGSVLNSLNSTIVGTSMQTALQWAEAEKSMELKALELSKQLDILDSDKKIKEIEIDTAKHNDIINQANSLRQNGAATVVEGKVVKLSDTGKVWTDMQLVKQNTENAVADGKLIDSKEKEINASIHKIVADTYVNYGSYGGYNITDSGVTGITPTISSSLETLSDLQKVIAKEQAKGYAYNAWATAASGLGSTIGTALASEIDIFGGQKYGSILTDWSSTVQKLKNIKAPSI